MSLGEEGNLLEEEVDGDLESGGAVADGWLVGSFIVRARDTILTYRSLDIKSACCLSVRYGCYILTVYISLGGTGDDVPKLLILGWIPVHLSALLAPSSRVTSPGVRIISNHIQEEDPRSRPSERGGG